VCFQCYKADPNKGRWKDRPAPHQQFQSARRQDVQALAPRSSWWITPRASWGEAIAEQLPRLHAIGAEVPFTQRGLSE
jgi:hypothetical protein